MFIINRIAALLFSIASLSIVAATNVHQGRELKTCATLKSCYMVNIASGDEVVLDGKDMYKLDARNLVGYSIRCDVISGPDRSSDFIRFIYDSKVFDEYKEPRYMKGNRNTTINPVSYLSICGPKRISVEVYASSTACSAQEFLIDVVYIDGSCPTTPLTNTPVNPPPTRSPSLRPTGTPVKPPTNAPVEPPTNAPVEPPTSSPSLRPTNIPVKSPTIAPSNPPTPPPSTTDPTGVPTIRLTNTPVRLPTKVPLDSKNTCTNSYICPVNAFRIARRSCYDNFDDCQCKQGYVKKNGQCMKKPTNDDSSDDEDDEDDRRHRRTTIRQ